MQCPGCSQPHGTRKYIKEGTLGEENTKRLAEGGCLVRLLRAGGREWGSKDLVTEE